MITGLLVGAVVGIVLAAGYVALIRWIERRRTGRSVSLDLCEVCGAPSTHELGAVSSAGNGEGTGMVACYCRRHKPSGAVRVR